MKARLVIAALLLSTWVGCATPQLPPPPPVIAPSDQSEPERAPRFGQDRLAHSDTHTCAITNDGDLHCWGIDAWGAVGLGDRGVVLSATRVPGLPKVVSVAVDAFSTCAVGVDGGLYCSGSVFTPERKAAYLLKPTRVPGFEGVVSVALGHSHRCVLFSSGKVACFGNDMHLLGPRTDKTPYRGQMVEGLPPLTALVASYSGTCGLDAEGAVWCFGSHSCGSVTSDPSLPSVVPGLERVEQLSLSSDALCGISTDPKLGARATCLPCGQVRHDRPAGKLVPDLTGARLVSADADRGCAVFEAGRVACWGQLHHDSRYERAQPRVGAAELRPVPDLSGVVEIDAAPGSVCARSGDGAVHCWGRNEQGELGAGTEPWLAQLPAEGSILAKGPYTRIAAAEHVTCGLTAGGNVECFGASLEADAAKLVSSISGASALSSAGRQICATVPNGEPICFPPAEPRPEPSLARLSGVRSIARGHQHACAVMSDGSVRCVGENRLGQLGRDGAASANPSQVPGVRDVRELVVGSTQSCALTTTGAVYCWGVDDRVGERAGKNARRATRVLTDVVEVAAGERHFCALNTRKEVWCWGTDTYGQLGDSKALVYQLDPVLVKTPGEVAHIALGRDHSCVLLAAGDVHCWGDNANGQLGDTVARKFYERPMRVDGLPRARP